jgi:hypothetical protein
MQNASRIRLFVDRSVRNAVAASVIWIPLCIGSSAPCSAQEAAQSAESAVPASTPVVPQQVRYTGKLTTRAGDAVEAEFRIYAAAEGGDPLWTETQRVAVGEDGSYSVQLGSASPAGLPQTVFAGGAARWLGVSIERSPEQERVLLSSVPYAMKSADAESLAGHPASDFVTQQQLATLAAQPALQPGLQSKPAEASSATPLTSGTVTGEGTAGTVPLWTGANTQGNSKITQSGVNIGINQPAPGSTLDVGGAVNVAGNFTLPAVAAATASTGQRSQYIELTSSSFSSMSKAPVASNFKILANFLDNDTATPSGRLEFHYQPSASASSLNVFSINGDGTLNFATGQTFPGTIQSVSASSPVTATTTSGAVSLALNIEALQGTLNSFYARLGAANTFSAPIAFASGQTFPGTINSVTGTGPVTATTTSGAVTLGLNITGLEPTLNNLYPQLATANDFAGYAYFGQSVTANEGFTGYSTGEYATDSSVLGITGSDSSGSQIYQNRYVINAGVWGDNSGNTTLGASTNAGVIGTADNNPAGLFYNNSKTYPSVTAINFGTKGTGLFTTLMAASPDGTCGIGSSGDLTCTGQVKTLASTGGGTRKVETYAMQSPENWMEDFGSGLLQNGVAIVSIDPSFAETVSATADYHVFLTPRGDSKGLYVINETPTSFEVRESSGGTSSLSFDYRIVAKRRGYEAERLTDVTEKFKAESQLSIPPKSRGTQGNPRVRPQMRKNAQNPAGE